MSKLIDYTAFALTGRQRKGFQFAALGMQMKGLCSTEASFRLYIRRVRCRTSLWFVSLYFAHFTPQAIAMVQKGEIALTTQDV